MDSAQKIISCMQLAAKNCNEAIPTDEAVSHIIGISLHPAIKQLFELEDDRRVERLVLAYKEAYLQQDVTPCPLFEGVENLLAVLASRKVTLAVATGKARRGLRRAWEQTATQQYFSFSRTADEAHSKPSPDMLLQLLNESGFSASEALMIGDTTYDMQMAEAIGMDRLGVSYGVHAAVNLAKHHPVEIVHSIPELQEYLLRVTKS